jgi:hypothetical protein
VFRRELAVSIVASIAVFAAIGIFGKVWARRRRAGRLHQNLAGRSGEKHAEGKTGQSLQGHSSGHHRRRAASFLLSYSCSGCHGGGGGGGMCPPLTNDIWVYGGDDDTLFRLVTLGSDELQKQGYTRIGRENVVGPMPPFGAIIKNSDDLWKILAFVRSKYSGDPAYKFGAPPPPGPAS